MTQHIQGTCSLYFSIEISTRFYEDNVAYTTQLRKKRYIKGDMTKYILQKLFSTHDLKKE